MTSMTKLYLFLASILILFGLGFGAGWKCHAPKPLAPSATAPKPEVIQSDGSRILERKVDPKKKPPMQIQAGDTVEHTGSVTIQPLPSLPHSSQIDNVAVPCPPCPPVKLNWTLVKEPDGGQRLIVKAEGGIVTGGEDIIVNPPAPAPKIPKWTVVATRYIRERTYGITGLRTYGPVVIGATIKQARAEFGSGRISVDGAVSVGAQF